MTDKPRLLLLLLLLAAVAATHHPTTEMLLKMPVVLSKHEQLLECFKTGVGLNFDDTGIEHCQMHRHAVSGSAVCVQAVCSVFQACCRVFRLCPVSVRPLFVAGT